MAQRIKSVKENPLLIFLFVSSFCTGLFNESLCAVASLVLSVALIIKLFKSKRVFYSKSVEMLAIAAVVLFMLISAFWAVDKYFALLGFVKFFPILPFFLLLCNTEKQKREELLYFVPLSAAIMAVVSAIFTFLKIAPDLFAVNGRIAGFFQYSNTFALYMIIGIIIISFKSKITKPDIVMLAVLAAGVFLSGSRTSFAALLLSFAAIAVFSKSKRLKVAFGVILALLVAAGVVYYFLSRSTAAFARFLTISVNSTTFKGRLIYAYDAIRYIVKHPMGLGYMGYYFRQGSFQSAVYSNTFVHNDILQPALDIGFIPAILIVIAFVRAIMNKNISIQKKIILAIVFLHSLLEFNLQFLSVVFIVIICAFDDNTLKEIKVGTAHKISALTVCFFAAVLSVWLGTSSGLYTLRKPEAAAIVYKHNTFAQIEILSESELGSVKEKSADIILESNKDIAMAYAAKAREYWEQGDVENCIKYEKQAIKKNRYDSGEYRFYSDMLEQATKMYYQSGDYGSAEYCKNQFSEFTEYLRSVKAETNKWAYDLPQQPDFDVLR